MASNNLTIKVQQKLILKSLTFTQFGAVRENVLKMIFILLVSDLAKIGCWFDIPSCDKYASTFNLAIHMMLFKHEKSHSIQSMTSRRILSIILSTSNKRYQFVSQMMSNKTKCTKYWPTYLYKCNLTWLKDKCVTMLELCSEEFINVILLIDIMY